MKQKLLLLLFFVAAFASAQNINIPDANFKAALLGASTSNNIAKNSSGNPIVIDVNGDGQIQQGEAELVAELDVSGSAIVSMVGIEAFNNLELLNCDDNDITSLDVTALENLETLQCRFNELTTLAVAGLEELRGLYCNNNELANLNLNGLEELRWLECFANNLQELNVTALPDLRELKCGNNQLQSLDVAGLDHLEILYCNDNEIDELDLEGLDSLEDFNCSVNPITELDLSGLEYLEQFNCAGTFVTTLDLNNNTNIQLLTFYGTPLVTLFIKNGQNEEFDPANFIENPELEYICADAEHVVELQEIVGDGIEVNSYCSYEPGGIVNAITGIARFDSATDECDETDTVIPFLRLTVTDGAYEDAVYADDSGNYTVYPGTGSYIVTPQFEHDYFEAGPVFAEFPAVDGTIIPGNICVIPFGVHPDVEVVIAPVTAARPGLEAEYKIVYRNKGNQYVSGAVTLGYDEPRLDLVSSEPAPATTGEGTVGWNYIELPPFGSREILVTFNVNAPADTPPVNVGDVLPFTVGITPDDETITDNGFEYNQEVTEAIGSNNVQCLEGETASPETIGNYLHYMVNFENTGTVPASFVVVKYDVNDAQFDAGTLQVIKSSHAARARVTGNTIEFRFSNINLAAADHGNILFKVKPKSSLHEGDQVVSKVNIYFEYNAPVETNEAKTTFGALGTGEFSSDNSVKVYPNPAKDVINVEAGSVISRLELYDIQGRLLQISTESSTGTSLELSSRQHGVYFLKVTTEKGVKVERIVKQ